MSSRTPKQCVVSGALACALRVSRAAGIAPLQLMRVHTGWRARVSQPASIYGNILAVTLCLLTQAAFITDVCTSLKIPYEYGTQVRRTVYFIKITLMTLVILTAAFTGTKRMENMIVYLNQIHKINFELSGYGCPPSDGKKYWLLLVLPMIGGPFIIILDFVVFLYNIIVNHGTVLSSTMYTFYYILYIIRVILQVQFDLIAVSVLLTLKRLNDCLHDLLEDTKSHDLTETTTKLPRDLPKAVRHLKNLHCCATEAFKLVDKSYGPILLLLMLTCLQHLVVTFYSFISHFLINEGSLNFKTVMHSLWATFHTSSIIMIVEPCHQTQEEVENTRLIVCQMTETVLSPDDPLSVELELFNRHLTLNQVAYSPLKMFTVNRALMVTMFGVITTYLTIIISF